MSKTLQCFRYDHFEDLFSFSSYNFSKKFQLFSWCSFQIFELKMYLQLTLNCNVNQHHCNVIIEKIKVKKGLFHNVSTNAKYPRLKNLYKMLLDHLYRMAQATYNLFFLIGLFVNEILKITTRWQTQVCKTAKINFKAHTYCRKLVFVSKYMFWNMWNLNLGLIKANFAIKLCFNSIFSFLGGKLGVKNQGEGLNKILKQKYW